MPASLTAQPPLLGPSLMAAVVPRTATVPLTTVPLVSASHHALSLRQLAPTKMITASAPQIKNVPQTPVMTTYADPPVMLTPPRDLSQATTLMGATAHLP